MPKSARILTPTDNATINIALDTISSKKQALVFVGSKRGAEKAAEDIAKKLKPVPDLDKLSFDILSALTKPTKQCERLAQCIKKGIAFHHAGLVAKQRELIENAFRENKIKIICCTPTLCISQDTKIWHNISETEVSKFMNSKPLFALSNNKLTSMKSQKIEKISNSSKLIKISSISGYSIKVTPNHKMLIKRKNKKVIVPASDIKKTDKIATIGKLRITKNSRPKIKNFLIDKEYSGDNILFNLELSYFIGAMLGDGYSGAETNNGKIKYKGSPCIVGIDEEIFLSTRNICGLLNLNCRRTKTHHGTPMLVLGKNNWFREFLVRCGVEKRDKKHIAHKLMEMEDKNVAALLRGLFDTDGYVQKHRVIGFSNTSEVLVKQTQKLLLRFGIVSRLRKRKAGSMKIYEKEHKTLPQFEITITQKRCIIDFYRYVGFNIHRKEGALIDLVAKILSNVNYTSCSKCNYRVFRDIFSGRNKNHKRWGKIKLKVIKLLGEKTELGSRELKRLIGHEPKNKENRLNHHYELIKKRRVGNRSKTEWFWSLNQIGQWIYDNIIKKNRKIEEFFGLKKCPICNTELGWVVKKGWRDRDFEVDIFWDVIRDITEVDEEKYVYDVVLPNTPKNDHMFVAEGFIVHNSAGLDLPAFRTVIRDLKRFEGRWGAAYIPVLEFLQMAGRAGRPKFDKFGEAITIARTESGKEEIWDRYINGQPENIYSKLAVEPVLRTYILSLIATGFVGTKQEIIDFFSESFWAHQFKDMVKLEAIITKMLDLLEEFEFIQFSTKDDEFKTADEIFNEKIKATKLGHRVAELYIDPLTAHKIIEALRMASGKEVVPFSFLHMLCSTLEIRPLLRVKVKEFEAIQEKFVEYEEYLLEEEPDMYGEEYQDFMNSVKTALFMQEWIEEKEEEFLLEKYDIRPGEIRVKLERSDWLLYASEELARMMQFKSVLKEISKLRFRLKYGVKEELLALLQLKNIGRVRARKLFSNNIKTIGDVKKADVVTIAQILGKKIAIDIKEQVGQSIDKQKVPEKRRKGQISLRDY